LPINIEMRILKNPLLKIAALWSLILNSNGIFASEILTSEQIYRRCYARMVRLQIPENDVLLNQVKSGAKLPVNACLELFDRARFAQDGVLVNRADGVAKSVLRTFHDIHQSWFQVKSHGFPAASYLVRDNEEPALFFTRAAMTPAMQFRAALTLNHGLAGVRDQKNYPNEGNPFKAQRIITYGREFPYALEEDLILAYRNTIYDGTNLVTTGTMPLRLHGSQIVEVGTLVGVKPAVEITLPSFFSATIAEPEIQNAVKSAITNFQVNKHFGGGVLGSQNFLLLNTNLVTQQFAKEYTIISRRTTNRIFEDLLCHRLPTLTDADVAAEVKPDSIHGFQKTTSCMRCHSSMDGMAYGFRNFFVFTTAGTPALGRQEVGLNISGIDKIKPVSGASNFALQPAVGTLHFRELMTGTLRKGKFNSMSELGQILSDYSDFYNCAAKRYYQYFTGVNVDLNALADKPIDKIHQDKVIMLGQRLKSHQSVRALLSDIFLSDAFKYRNHLTMADQ
jgi:hypothetical protein